MPSQVATCLRLARQFSADPSKVRISYVLYLHGNDGTDKRTCSSTNDFSHVLSPAVFDDPKSTRLSPPQTSQSKT